MTEWLFSIRGTEARASPRAWSCAAGGGSCSALSLARCKKGRHATRELTRGAIDGPIAEAAPLPSFVVPWPEPSYVGPSF